MLKFGDRGKSKKQLIAQYLNDLKSSNAQKVGKALLELFLANYDAIEEEARKFEHTQNNFIKFATTYIFAMKGNFDYLLKLIEYIKDDSEYIRKVAIGGINSLFKEKIITNDYIDVDKLKDEYYKIKEKLEILKDKVKWDEEEKMYIMIQGNQK